jgi:hypothetical protein
LTHEEAPLDFTLRSTLRKVWAVLLGGVAAAGLLAAQSPGRATAELNDRGTFEMFSGATSLGTETFEIRVRGEQVEAQATVHLQVNKNGKSVEVRTTSTLLLDSHFDPLSYTWSQKGAQSSQLSVDFRTQPAHARYKTVTGHDDQRDFKMDRDVVLLDDNAIHQYELAVARYDAAKGGAQTFSAFVPQEALPGVISLTLKGPEPMTVNGVSATLRHFILSTELAQINLWADDHGHLQMVSAPDAEFLAMRTRQ